MTYYENGPDVFSTPFEPDQVLPVQYFTTHVYWKPTIKLMRAVLEDAITCYIKGKISALPKNRRQADRDKEWFLSRESLLLFSFENVCDVLDLNADAIREKLFSGSVRMPSNRHIVGRCTYIK